jgi:hypothetical protein
VYCGISQVTMYCNTITNNQAFSGSGVFGSGGTLINCIVWQNTGNQIGFYPGGSFTITYSDIQDSLWPGQGNISADPIFVNPEQNDYRLLWGSPCIDSGDPNPQYNDPDSTRSDMGAFYYDQSVPVRVLLTPYNAPIQIPPEGGTFDYAITASNCTGSPLMADFWCDATLPSESLTEPLLGPRAATIPAYDNVSVMRTQRVPGAMPKAITYNGYAVVGADTSKDGFSVWIGTWGQQSATGRTQAAAPLPFAMGNWSNWGEWFEIAGRAQSAAADAPTEFALHPAAPNPFNASTALSFQLPANSFVSLRVYDTAGRLVETLVKGWREAGSHEVTFDASNLASGVYICCLASESTQAVQKMLLIK